MVEEEFRWAGAEEGYPREGDVEGDVEEDDEDNALGREALEGARCEARGERCPGELISIEFSESHMLLILKAGYSRALPRDTYQINNSMQALANLGNFVFWMTHDVRSGQVHRINCPTNKGTNTLSPNC